MDIERINYLAKKAKAEGLTDEEKAEQAKLRREYIDSVTGNLRAQLENVYIVDEKGNKVKYDKKETDYLPLWEPLDRAKEAPVKKELTKAEEAEKKRKQRETEAFKKRYFEYYDDVKISHREDW